MGSRVATPGSASLIASVATTAAAATSTRAAAAAATTATFVMISDFNFHFICLMINSVATPTLPQPQDSPTASP